MEKSVQRINQNKIPTIVPFTEEIFRPCKKEVEGEYLIENITGHMTLYLFWMMINLQTVNYTNYQKSLQMEL